MAVPAIEVKPSPITAVLGLNYSFQICKFLSNSNGPVWAKWKKRLWEKLADAPRRHLNGKEFRLWYLKIPAWVLAEAV